MKIPKKILIIQTAFLGDVILATSLVEKLKLTFPNSTIDFLLKKGYESIFESNPHLNEILTLDKSKKIKSLYKNILLIREKKYDLVINCQRFFTSGLLTVFSNANQTIGFDKNPFSIFYTLKIKHEFNKIHEIERNQKLISHVTNNESSKPCLFTNHINIDEFINSEYITISPASIWFTKQFPTSKWVELIQNIPSKYKIYLLGASSDIRLCEEIKAKCGGNIIEIVAGKFSFLKSAALMKNAKMNFVNDSAPMHLASAVNAPVCAIYCSTLPSFGFGPLSDISYIIQVDEPLNCRPCGIHGLKKCPETHFDCANKLEIYKIIKTVKFI